MVSGDIIQISLGSSANAVTAHSLNLQGLTGTDPKEGCDISITHRLERNHVVPRCILVDEPTGFFASTQISQAFEWLQSTPTPFAIQPLESALSLQHLEPNPWSQNYQALSSTLAYSSFSRFYHERPAVVSPEYRASQENSRHVNWDDDDDGEDEDNQEDGWSRQERKQREFVKWQKETLEPVQSQLLQAVDQPASPLDSASTDKPNTSLSWMDYWMPPYSEQSKIALEHCHQSHLNPHWDSYHPYNSASSGSDWMENVLWDRLRRLLEESDSCQGVLVTTQGHGIYAGLTTALLQELQQESKNAARFVFHITNPHTMAMVEESKDQQETIHENEAWQPAHVQRVRHHINSGSVMHDFTQNAHVVLPLELPTKEGMSLFRSSAELALAIDACTLPIRFATDSTSARRIGLTNAPFLGQDGDYDMSWGSTAKQLSMSEYIQCLQPSTQYKVLELDTLATNVDDNRLWQSLLSGTSLQQDARTRATGNSYLRPRDVPPGGWLQSSSRDGLLSNLSPHPSTNPRFGDRSLHRHFSLSTSVRPATLEPSSDPRYQYDPTAPTINHYLTAIIQGMGITHRPERSVATIGSQTVGRLTFGNFTSGGAGAYWKSILQSNLEQPTMAVLGNSTRVFSYLDQVASDMKLVLTPRFRGYIQRDNMNGVLPEAEDCHAALEECFNLRDAYHPPDGSGLVDDDDGDIDR